MLRGLARATPLVAARQPGGGWRIEYAVCPAELPEEYFSIAVLHALQGKPLAQARGSGWRISATARTAVPELVSYFDSVRLDLRCCRDMRLKFGTEGRGMLAAEVLSFGAGMVRARNDDPRERLHRHIWSRYGRLHSRPEHVYARIRTLHRNSAPSREEVGKESFDSTNVVFGDTLGELEQLWARRADTAFLELVAQSLQEISRCEIATFCHPPLDPGAIMQLHWRAQRLWKAPPVNGRALLRRLDFILSHTVVDDNPQTVYRWRRADAMPRPLVPPRSPGAWTPDHSGYDGWLK
jgi:hypothetical protein